MSRISVVRAVSAEDFATVDKLRANAVARTLRQQGARVIHWVDVADRNGSAFTLIARDRDGQAVGTVRLQDSRLGVLELQRFVDLAELLSADQRPAVQMSRLAVPRGSMATVVMLALFKAAWAWCRVEGIKTMVVAVPRRSSPLYGFMHFSEVGRAGRFRHAFAGSQLHTTMILPVQDVESTMREAGHPLLAHFAEMPERPPFDVT